MLHIIKSQFYQLRRDKFTLCVLLFFGGIYTALTCSELAGTDAINGGMAFVAISEWFVVFIFYMTVMLVGRICGWDFNDKTINYEVLSGHKRSEVFFGRALFSFVLISLLCVLMLGLPMLAGVISGGWGANLSPADALLRSALILLVMLRFVAEIVFVSFLVRNCFAGMLICAILPEIFMVFPLLSGNKNMYFLSSVGSLFELMNFENARQGFVDGEDITVYLAGLEPAFVVSVAISALVLIVICTAAGYLYMKKRDM